MYRQQGPLLWSMHPTRPIKRAPPLYCSRRPRSTEPARQGARKKSEKKILSCARSRLSLYCVGLPPVSLLCWAPPPTPPLAPPNIDAPYSTQGSTPDLDSRPLQFN